MSGSPAASAGNLEFRWLQALRAIAALMVLFFHMRPHWSLAPALAPLTDVMRWGFCGVDIFFVLSGFVVYRSAVKQLPRAGLALFLKKRLARIFPVYWCVLLLLAVVALFTEQPFPDTRKILLSFFLLEPGVVENWLAPAWSLTYELYFYTWIGAIVFFAGRWRLAALVALIVVLATWNYAWLALELNVGYPSGQPFRFFLTALGLEFLAGAMIAHFHLEHREWFRYAIPLAFVGCVLAVAGMTLGQTSAWFDQVEPLRAASFGLVGCGALVLGLALEESNIPTPLWLVRLGDASFSLYLLHTFLLDNSGYLRHGLKLADTNLLLFMIALPILIVAASLLWHWWIELRLMKMMAFGERRNLQAFPARSALPTTK